jgi:hypothetical protein
MDEEGSRIHIIENPKDFNGSGFLFLRDEINQFYPIPANWWKIAEFDPGSGKPILIYRVLTRQDALKEIKLAQIELIQRQNPDVMMDLLGAAVNARDVKVAFDAWKWLNLMDSDKYSLELISPTIIESFNMHALMLGENLLDKDRDTSELDDLKVDFGLEQYLTSQEDQLFNMVSISLDRALAEPLGVYTNIKLKPDRIYIYTVQVKSNSGVDLLRVNGGEIRDSHDFSQTYDTWREVVVVFITPSEELEDNFRIDLLTLKKPVDASIRNPRLYEVQLGQP